VLRASLVLGSRATTPVRHRRYRSALPLERRRLLIEDDYTIVTDVQISERREGVVVTERLSRTHGNCTDHPATQIHDWALPDADHEHGHHQLDFEDAAPQLGTASPADRRHLLIALAGLVTRGASAPQAPSPVISTTWKLFPDLVVNWRLPVPRHRMPPRWHVGEIGDVDDQPYCRCRTRPRSGHTLMSSDEQARLSAALAS
jgi:hypothetical protein